MNSQKNLLVIVILLCLSLFISCSKSNSPLTPNNSNSTDTIPITSSDEIGYLNSGVGLLGAYELILDPIEMTGDLVPKRSSTIGESWVVNGISYFTISPCGDCLKIRGIIADSGGIAVQFELKHPFELGNPADPPSAKNRQDLDIFDVALVIAPLNEDATNYQKTGDYVYNNICFNQDGYTHDLSSLLGDNTAMPYFLVIDDSETGTSTWNEFEMGSLKSFIAFFSPRSSLLTFDLYLTMGYGASATWKTRFAPKYYNPEFNRKSAWKIDVRYEGSWTRNDIVSPIYVEVLVYDWQIGAPVASAMDFADASTNEIYAASDVASVSVEIPGMNSTLNTVTTPTSGTGTPADPLIYNFAIANENGLYEDTYIGLVKVTDERPVGVVPPGGVRDFLVSSPDGITRAYIPLPEFATYQTFKATVYGDCTEYCWTRTWGGPDWDSAESVTTDTFGNVYVTGTFQEIAQFDPNGGGYQISKGSGDAFLSKFDSNGDWKWTRTWGGPSSDGSAGVGVTSLGIVYVAGHFKGTTEFNPYGGGEKTSLGQQDMYLSKFHSNGNWLGTVTWGGTSYDIVDNLTVSSTDEIYVTGYFDETCDFDPAGGTPLTSNGGGDCYLSKFDSDGIWQWATSWGGTDGERGLTVETNPGGDVFVAGFFFGTADFNPAGGNSVASKGEDDCFLSRFNSSGNWLHTRAWGGPGKDVASSCAVDSTGQIYVTGYFAGTSDFNPAGGGSMTADGNWGIYLSKFDATTLWQWAVEWGGPSHDIGMAVETDASDNIYVCGRFRYSADLNPSGGFPVDAIGIDDCFVSKFDSAGVWQWAKTWGGADMDIAWSVATFGTGVVYVTGAFNDSAMFDPDGGDIQFSNGTGDAFLWKYID
ncbi:MAG: hypothetical protein ABIG42_03590 [bacterium]